MVTSSDPAAEALATIPAEAAGDPFVRVFTLLAALRRRWRLWSVTALVGLALGGVFFAAKPPQWSATTTVVLQRPASTVADPARQMETDVQLAQSATVLNVALGNLPRGTLTRDTVSSLSNDVLQIATQAPTARAAVTSANALAHAFLSFRAQQLTQEAQVTAAAVKLQTDPLMAQVATLNDQINAATQQSTSSTVQSRLGELLAGRAQLNGQLATIQQRSDNASLSTSVAVQNSRVLDPATPTRPSKIRTGGVDLAAGLIGGAVAGAGWVLFVATTTERVRRREDVMIALDAPVALSVVSRVARRRSGHRTVRGYMKGEPQSRRDVTLMVRHLRQALAACDTTKPALLVVSVDSDWSAAPVVAAAAAGLRGEGSGTLMADFSKEAALAHLLRAREQITTLDGAPPASKLWLGTKAADFDATLDEWLQLNELASSADVILTLATLDPAVGAGHLADLATTAVVVVTAGRSTATVLRSTGRMIRAAGIQVHSAMLVGADRNDETCGWPLPRPPAHTDTRALQENR